MILPLIALCGSVLTFWLPLLLTAKSLSSPNISSSSDSSAVFLLNYWVSFVALSQLQAWLVPSENHLVTLASHAAKCWLFYCHGCLIVNYYYVDSLLRRVLIKNTKRSKSSFSVIESKLIDPLFSTLINNVLVQNIMYASSHSRVQWLRATAAFNFELNKSRLIPSSTFLQTSLDYLCFMDDPIHLQANYEKSMDFFDSLTSVLTIPTSAPSPTSPASGSKFNPIQDFKLRRMARSENKRDGFKSSGQYESPPTSQSSHTYDLDTDALMKYGKSNHRKLTPTEQYYIIRDQQDAHNRRYESMLHNLQREQRDQRDQREQREQREQLEQREQREQRDRGRCASKSKGLAEPVLISASPSPRRSLSPQTPPRNRSLSPQPAYTHSLPKASHLQSVNSTLSASSSTSSSPQSQSQQQRAISAIQNSLNSPNNDSVTDKQLPPMPSVSQQQQQQQTPPPLNSNFTSQLLTPSMEVHVVGNTQNLSRSTSMMRGGSTVRKPPKSGEAGLKMSKRDRALSLGAF